MDRFLTAQNTEGERVSEGSFTLSPEDTRRKLMESAPSEPAHAKLLLLLDTLRLGGYDTQKCVKLKIFKKHVFYCVRNVKATLQVGSLNKPKRLFEALREPFKTNDAALTQFTRFAYWTAGQGFTLLVKWPGGKMTLSKKNDLEKSGQLPEEADWVVLNFKLPDDHLTSDRAKAHRELFEMHQRPVRLLPEEAFQSLDCDRGYFQYRSKPFVLMKRFVLTEETPAIQIDLWESPYTALKSDLLIMDRAKPGRWLYHLWRPNYGRPALSLQFSNHAPTFGKLCCQAVFWVQLSEQKAAVSLSRGDYFRDFIPIEGPPGLRGRVIWPNLKPDTYGWKLVEDENFQNSIRWSEEQAALMTTELSQHWEKIYQAAARYKLFKGPAYYKKEIKQRMSALWGG